ncbi:hypothetical protein NVP1031O_106 [Vibrio phage 1.031.O._10N.261.46.F8]|nr:hypothetical protein NVP1031O_106 [Vibrio phage 1.031.O._10N.261.46.F8]
MEVKSRLTKMVEAFRDNGVIPREIIHEVPTTPPEKYEGQSYKLTEDEREVLSKSFGDEYGLGRVSPTHLTGPVEMLRHYLNNKSKERYDLWYYHSDHYERFNTFDHRRVSASTDLSDLVTTEGNKVAIILCKQEDGFMGRNTLVQEDAYIDDYGVFAKLFEEHVIKPATTNLQNIRSLLAMPTVEDKIHLMHDLLGDTEIMDAVMDNPALRVKLLSKFQYQEMMESGTATSPPPTREGHWSDTPSEGTDKDGNPMVVGRVYTKDGENTTTYDGENIHPMHFNMYSQYKFPSASVLAQRRNLKW